MKLINSWEILLWRDYILFIWGFVWGCFMAGSVFVPSLLSHLSSYPQHYVHFVTSACLRAAILVMSAQGVRPWANPCPRRAPLPIPLLAYAAAEDALHLRNAKIPASQLQFCSSPQLPPQTYTKRGLTLSFHRWDRCHTSRQLLLPGKHESPSREAAEVPQTVTFSFF